MGWLLLVGLVLLGTGAVASAHVVAPGSLGRLARWPVDPSLVSRIGDGLGAGREHQGVDLFVPAGTPVLAPEDLHIVRAINGSLSTKESQQKAGQWVDGRGAGGRILRFLHLRENPPVKAGDSVRLGALVGFVAETGTSGNLRSPPHLHFEVRQAPVRGQAYGPARNPLALLPPTGRSALDGRLEKA